MTLREQILALPLYQSIMYDPKAVEHYRDSVLALLSEGPTPTEIEAGALALANERRHEPGRLSLRRQAEAVLRAPSEATPCSD